MTFEWLMERIVGELAASGAGSRITVLADGSALIDGLALVTDVNEQFGLHIDEDTYTTLGGYVLGRLGRRARVGDAIEVEGRTMRVDALDGLRVARGCFVVRAALRKAPDARIGVARHGRTVGDRPHVRLQQPQAVGDDEQRGAGVGHDGHPERRRPRRRRARGTTP